MNKIKFIGNELNLTYDKHKLYNVLMAPICHCCRYQRQPKMAVHSSYHQFQFDQHMKPTKQRISFRKYFSIRKRAKISRDVQWNVIYITEILQINSIPIGFGRLIVVDWSRFGDAILVGDAMMPWYIISKSKVTDDVTNVTDDATRMSARLMEFTVWKMKRP